MESNVTTFNTTYAYAFDDIGIGIHFVPKMSVLSVSSVVAFVIIIILWIHMLIKSKTSKKKLNPKLIILNSFLFFLFGGAALTYGVLRTNYFFEWTVIGLPCTIVYGITLWFWMTGKSLMSIFFFMKVTVSFHGSVFQVKRCWKWGMIIGILTYYFVGCTGWILFTFMDTGASPEWVIVGIDNNNKQWLYCVSRPQKWSKLQTYWVFTTLTIPEIIFQFIICHAFVSRLIKLGNMQLDDSEKAEKACCGCCYCSCCCNKNKGIENGLTESIKNEHDKQHKNNNNHLDTQRMETDRKHSIRSSSIRSRSNTVRSEAAKRNDGLRRLACKQTTMVLIAVATSLFILVGQGLGIGDIGLSVWFDCLINSICTWMMYHFVDNVWNFILGNLLCCCICCLNEEQRQFFKQYTIASYVKEKSRSSNATHDVHVPEQSTTRTSTIRDNREITRRSTNLTVNTKNDTTKYSRARGNSFDDHKNSDNNIPTSTTLNSNLTNDPNDNGNKSGQVTPNADNENVNYNDSNFKLNAKPTTSISKDTDMDSDMSPSPKNIDRMTSIGAHMEMALNPKKNSNKQKNENENEIEIEIENVMDIENNDNNNIVNDASKIMNLEPKQTSTHL